MLQVKDPPLQGREVVRDDLLAPPEDASCIHGLVRGRLESPYVEGPPLLERLESRRLRGERFEPGDQAAGRVRAGLQSLLENARLDELRQPELGNRHDLLARLDPSSPALALYSDRIERLQDRDELDALRRGALEVRSDASELLKLLSRMERLDPAREARATSEVKCDACGPTDRWHHWQCHGVHTNTLRSARQLPARAAACM